MAKENLDLRLNIPDSLIAMKPVTFVSGSGSAVITAYDARSLTLHAVITSQEAKIALRRFYFPGWVANPADYTVAEYKSLVSVALKQGTYDVKLEVPWFPGEREGLILSLGAMILLLGIFAFARLQAIEDGNITKASRNI